ncbi:methyltransferase domain-containing protein [Lutimaribacter sp. EGI FJ00015]|uniref:Methyltransferase domain-containing protein n=1 Tax=Lutimaribacter degradans TaxID=2945989 RepID=A0ACC5ZR53_9RHOB|nr:methyltransferase domain-containing protein [Lutimaribacter sp. EGI FJ00013]MCM2560747.1 methyltransferase domain-containing protein [Lutimaribacter sp. EGI FJ00013]MCO0612307.1 methyltransferase domain-containing protein [Lutimaribacter sp. EGI FJ00015]MCO0634572.1 methyltransferase domain-containing protein [Lutimaribacter sp. EGI FJ00014]
MPADADSPDERFQSLREGSTDAQAVQAYYDDWAENYDSTLSDWNYRAPQDACDLLVPHLPEGARILDVGCGTGLMGDALRARGDYVLDGVDISGRSLAVAVQRGSYAELVQHDLQQLPLPFGDDAVDAAVSVGVLTYVDAAEPLMRDLCRIVCGGGAIAFTQRDDLWATRRFPDMLKRLEDEGLWQVAHVSEPRAYLPGNDDFGDEIKVIHTLCKVA